ncbi:MAG: hypothetical protein KatS3mg035_0759 [Bacteroidia bacterium]|nr:MAG: hypothetical protein KatS3mg035_0759 [Bacteroidia bacterium]
MKSYFSIPFLLLFSSLFFVQNNPDFKVGWCVYSFEAHSQRHLDMIQKCKPSIIRWFMEWDRHDVIKNGQSLRKQRLEAYKPFFELCAKQNITLVVQIWVKDRLWAGDGDGGTQWAKPDKFTNYPANIQQSYGTFVRELVDIMNLCGVPDKNIILEAWNEPDLLWGIPNTNPPNYHEPWKVFSKKGFSKWTGGSGQKWQELHTVLGDTHKDIRWANGSVGIHERYSSWIAPAYNIPQITVLDLHYYLWSTKTAQEYCDSVSRIIERWDKYLPAGKKPYPFFIGECAKFSSGNEENMIVRKEHAQMMREACTILSQKYKERFLGMTAHAPVKMWEKGIAWFDEKYTY